MRMAPRIMARHRPSGFQREKSVDIKAGCRSERAQGHKAIRGSGPVAKRIEGVVFPCRQKLTAGRRPPVINRTVDRLSDYTDQGIAADRPFLRAFHGRSHFIQLKDQTGGDYTVWKRVRFVAVERYPVKGAAGATPHARIHGLPSDVRGYGSQSSQLLPKSDGDPKMETSAWVRPIRKGSCLYRHKR